MSGFANVGMHHAGMPAYNPQPNVNRGNAGGGHSSAETRRARGTARGGPSYWASKLPAEAPVPGSLFTFERVQAMQCESGVVYPVKRPSDEHEYFTQCIEKLLAHIQVLHGAPSCDIIAAFQQADDLEVVEVKYHQLKRIMPVAEHYNNWGEDPDYRPTTYETYKDMMDDSKVFAVNPSGEHFFVTKANAWDWTFQLLIKGDLGSFSNTAAGDQAQRKLTYAMQMSVTKLPRNLEYQVKAGSKVLQVDFGELVAGSFVPWTNAKVYVADKGLFEALVSHKSWQPPQVEAEPEEECEQLRPGKKYDFKVMDNRLCAYFPGKKDEGEYKELANFTIDSVLAIYQYADRERGLPWFRYKVHMVIDAAKSESIYVTPESDVKLTMYRDVGRIDAEVLVPIDEVEDKTLSTWFSKVCSYFRCHGYFRVEHLIALTTELTPWPRITRIVTTFGRQPDSDLFVFGNCCYERGVLYTHEEMGVTVLPHLFGGKEVIIPIPLAKFPKILIVPQDWVRYTFFVNFYSTILPQQFLNNTMQAKASFALSVMHLQCSKFWDGGAVGDIVPTGWLKSAAPNTGKTEIVIACNAFAGWWHKKITMGACSSLPAVIKRLTMQRDLSLCLDEIATKVSADQEKSKKLKDIVHMCANGSSREVCGKSEEPLTTFIGTANIVVNEDDDAFLQRLLLILFSPLNAEGVDMSASAPRQEEWKAAKELLSCLQPDLERILWEGKLDREALTDWCHFMNLATSTVYSRNANLWGFLGYYMCMLEAMSQGTTEDLDAIFEFLCKSVVRQNYMATKHSSQMNQFVLAIHNCRTSAAANPLISEDRAIFWHNWRTTERPDNIFHQCVEYYAVRVEAVCNVIKKVLNLIFKPEEIRRSVEDCQFAFFGRAKFYDVSKFSYPPQKQYYDEETHTMTNIPLPEDELLECHVKFHRCIFFRKNKFDEIINEVDNVMRDAADYKTIMIKSARREVGTYNFYNALTMREPGWFGWRAAGTSAFGKYCGVKNEVANMRNVDHLELVPGVQQMCIDKGFGGLGDVFMPSNLLKYYGYTRKSDNSLPACLRINPFLFRNAENDTLMPDDPRSMHYHAGLVDDYDAPSKRQRDESPASSRMPLSESNTPRHPTAPKSVRIARRISESDDEGEDLFDEDGDESEPEADSEDEAFINDYDIENEQPFHYCDCGEPIHASQRMCAACE
ncbi:MAG: hypothetical protein CMO41_04540 [Verrucomicrobiales bacterium]|nr:hypothetical protein [Verrucomicrobiales bacterium]|tara:strand:- start:2625 stop:6194 length:3570 start_codon:yes stop_codon:yes gene_type:complete